ncbi:2-oxoglutarate and iron-dependent oxygenase domain-containing protein [Maritimibacter sp. UBA3975]|uniref:isopenicillin N synthase family dioxygenase n=1 Tax=Maritimibacter sp. UBA3975 TaxID=1946833 RepID=UPI000C09DB94|nr:2-oxoglutarate and iron-dependent oxygenase domain-containing protein [Maritimibacter sp. UBA3975]MAM60274.1 penicillin synthase [Maritimibacter sp.]|tara:strand:+ start:11167 stop:12156 length:990 start_codon:yes stop_codon:yes gene_type:complete
MILYEPPKAATEVPVIDLTDSFSDDLDKRKKVAWEIQKACIDPGFFYIKNHGIAQEVMDAQLDLAAQFFDLPLEEKMKLDSVHEASTRGYEPMAAQTLDEGSPPDLKEGFMSSVNADENHRYTKLNVPGTGLNQWPTEVFPEFEVKYEAYAQRVIELGRHLAGIVALSLELPEDYFAAGLEEPLHYCRILKYPPMPKDAAENQLGAGAHSDWGLLTLLLQDNIGGLEVRNANGDWIAAPPIPGTYVVNLGEMFPVITNDRYKATMHRVLNNHSDKTRYSCPTFVDPEYFYKVEIAPTILEHDGEAKYPPMTAGEHLRAQFEKSFGVAAA